MIIPWQPILQGDVARKAGVAIESIARTLAKGEAGFGPKAAEWHSATPADLALFFGYLAATTGSPEHKARAMRFLELAVQRFSAQAGAALYGGLCGLALTIRNLEQPPVNLAMDAGEVYSAADEYLLQRLRVSTRKGDYDVISGLVGYGVYVLARLPGRKAATALKLIVDRLERCATRRRDGITWFTPASELTNEQRAEAPKGYYNLGVAHGVPGVIGFLTRAYERGIERRKTLRLLDGAVSWVLAQRLPENSTLRLPAWIAPGTTPTTCRVAWCYGDLGASVALLHAARVTGREDWEKEALMLAHTAARCPFPESGTMDACLCHGAAGNGHLFNRLFQATGQEEFRQAAELYFRKTLEMRGRPPRVGGYSFWTWEPSRPDLHWRPAADFLNGLTGVGLALLAAMQPVEPRWDSVLLADAH